MISTRFLLFATTLIIVSVDGRELLRRADDVTSVVVEEIEIHSSSGEQRRELAWGTGTFSWLMYTMKLCHGKGPLCPPPPCHLGPKPPESWHCDEEDDPDTEVSTAESEVDTYYVYDENEEDVSGTSGTENDGSGSRSAGYSSTSVVGYIVAAAALTAITAAIVFKKKRGAVALTDESSIGGSVARRMELMGNDVPYSISVESPPTFIEMSSVQTTSNAAAGGGPVTNYINV